MDKGFAPSQLICINLCLFLLDIAISSVTGQDTHTHRQLCCRVALQLKQGE